MIKDYKVTGWDNQAKMTSGIELQTKLLNLTQQGLI